MKTTEQLVETNSQVWQQQMQTKQKFKGKSKERDQQREEAQTIAIAQYPKTHMHIQSPSSEKQLTDCTLGEKRLPGTTTAKSLNQQTEKTPGGQVIHMQN